MAMERRAMVEAAANNMAAVAAAVAAAEGVPSLGGRRSTAEVE